MKRKVFTMLCLWAALFAASLLWAREDHLVSSNLAPAARGTVQSETDRNGNTGFKVKVAHLAKPHDLQSGYSSYVVWVQPRGQAPANAGELRVNDDLQGSLETSTPFKQFDLFVTAENNPRATSPSGPEVLHTTVSRE